MDVNWNELKWHKSEFTLLQTSIVKTCYSPCKLHLGANTYEINHSLKFLLDLTLYCPAKFACSSAYLSINYFLVELVKHGEESTIRTLTTSQSFQRIPLLMVSFLRRVKKWTVCVIDNPCIFSLSLSLYLTVLRWDVKLWSAWEGYTSVHLFHAFRLSFSG